jgi:hypothetical protein
MNVRASALLYVAVAAVTSLGIANFTGCNAKQAAVALTRPAGEPGIGQEQFDSDDKAAAALVAAARARDSDALKRIFGPSVHEFVTGDKVEDEAAFDRFVKNAGDHLELEKIDNHTSVIDIGKDNWPFPIPLTRRDNGKWFFDTEAGKQEILDRVIGGYELETIDVCRAYVEAQREYATEDRNGDGVLQYAQRFISHNGKDGLYWPSVPGEEESPMGELMAEATLEGYAVGTGNPGPHPFHGYVYHILTRQGDAAAGGRYDYIINGRMIAGFALVACPTDYRTSGVMTFVISHQGKLYQKDLGPHTTEIARAMTEYNPDSTWTLVSQ